MGPLFDYHIDLDKRVRIDNPLRRVAEKIDFTFIREEVAKFYYRRESSLSSAFYI